MQETQGLKSKIISLLDTLPAESLQLLAEFTTFLHNKSAETDQQLSVHPEALPQIRSPRLVNQQQVVDFEMEVSEETSNDTL